MKFRYWNRVLLVIFFAAVFYKSVTSLDPDFGWHVTIGTLMFTKGIPTTDPFSYTMPSYHFVDHEWLTDIVIAVLYQWGGFWVLGGIFSLFPVITVFLLLRNNPSRFTWLFGLLGSAVFFGMAGIRPQVISWFFFLLLSLVLVKKDLWHKWKWALPLFFFIWANLHGGFASGFFLLVIFVLSRLWTRQSDEKSRITSSGRGFRPRSGMTKKISFDKLRKYLVESMTRLDDLVVLLLCFLATLINPYGIHLWQEVFVSLLDSRLRWSVVEWWPIIFGFNIVHILLVVFASLLVFHFRKKFSLFQLLSFSVFLWAGVTSIRNMPFFIIIAFPLIIQAMNWFVHKIAAIPLGKERFAKAWIVFSLIALVFFTAQIAVDYQGIINSQKEKFYPQQAIIYLKTHPTTGQLFSDYNWGGYFIWQYPEKKVFIDGRMPSWRNSHPGKQESAYAFGEYFDLLDGTSPFAKAVEKYQIDTVVLPPFIPKKPNVVDEYVENFINTVFHKQKHDVIYTQLKKMHWVIVYKDNTSVIYRPQAKMQNAKGKIQFKSKNME